MNITKVDVIGLCLKALDQYLSCVAYEGANRLGDTRIRKKVPAKDLITLRSFFSSLFPYPSGTEEIKSSALKHKEQRINKNRKHSSFY